MKDIELIRFVTRRFNELKGLQTATTGAILLSGSLILRFLFASSTYAIEPAYFVNAALSSSSFAWALFDPRYRATFGRSESGLSVVTVVLANIAFVIGLMIDVLAQKYVQWPSVAAVALGLSSFVVVVRDWRWRLHHVVPLAAAVVAAIVTASVPAARSAFSWEGESVRGSVFLFAYALMGAAMMVAGLLDHALLVQTLRRGPVADAGILSPDRIRAGRSEARIAAVVGGCALITLFFPAGEMVIALPFSLSMVGFTFWMLSIRRARRHQSWPQAAPAAPLDERRDLVVPLIVLAIAAVIDVALSAKGPIVCTAAFGAWSLSIAVRHWSAHRHYLVGAFTAAGLLVVMPSLVPARAVTVCVLAIATAVAIERYADSQLEATDVDTV